MNQVWFVDCFDDSGGTFPLASYGPQTIAKATSIALSVLHSERSGIERVVIARHTLGMNPRQEDEKSIPPT